MTITEKMLGQARENSTNAVSVYFLPNASTKAIIKTITLCNTSLSSANFSIYRDNDGTTYDESTAKYLDVSLASKATLLIDTYWAMNNASGNFAYKTSVANAITITLDGAEIT